VKHFTLESAEALVPELERVATAAEETKAKAEAKAKAIGKLEESGRDFAQLAIDRSQLEFLSRSLEDLLRSVEKKGTVLKGIDPFLVDFPFVLDGKTVYLCWTRGEKSIRHYHAMEEGFAQRKELPKKLLPR